MGDISESKNKSCIYDTISYIEKETADIQYNNFVICRYDSDHKQYYIDLHTSSSSNNMRIRWCDKIYLTMEMIENEIELIKLKEKLDNFELIGMVKKYFEFRINGKQCVIPEPQQCYSYDSNGKIEIFNQIIALYINEYMNLNIDRKNRNYKLMINDLEFKGKLRLIGVEDSS